MPTAIVGLGNVGTAAGDRPGGAEPMPVVSGLIEFGSALHVLRDPGHHDAVQWADDLRATMSPDLAAETRAWLWTAQAIRATPFVTATPPGDNFADRLDELRDMPARQLAQELLRPITRSGKEQALGWARARGPEILTVVNALVDRPAEAVDRFLRFLAASWQDWFASEWARVRPTLAARARQLTDITIRDGTVSALTSLDPSVTAASSPGAVRIAKVQNTRHDVSRRGLLAAASTIIRPHLYVADVPGRPLLLIYPAHPGSPAPPASELLRRADALAHGGRLEVARAIATEPRTAGEIAALWNMDPTQVNRHLRALAAAGLARRLRRGRFVQYQLNADTIQSLGTDLLGLLLR
jgi:DNA-binding transcriptional ArsR family regulator